MEILNRESRKQEAPTLVVGVVHSKATILYAKGGRKVRGTTHRTGKIEAISLGEALIDFVSTKSGVALRDAPGFKRAAGGAPANVAVGLSRLGVKTGFIGKVGGDEFGYFLAQTLERNRVDISQLHYETKAKTTLAFVSLKEEGERSFMFYRDPGADMLLSPQEIDENYIHQANIFHYGSITLISEPSRSATLLAAKRSSEGGLLVSYDPNLRVNLWDSIEHAKAEIKDGLNYANLVKVSEEELEFITGIKDLKEGSAQLLEGVTKLVIVTRGKEGCFYNNGKCNGYVKGFSVKTVDTTGAGDGFVAGLLTELLRTSDHISELREEELRDICRYANAVGALTTLKRGAIPSLPTKRKVERWLKES